MSNAVKALNLKLFADEKCLSPSITAIKTDEIDAEEFRKKIKNNLDGQVWIQLSLLKENLSHFKN